MSDTADRRRCNSDTFWYPPLAKADTYMDTKVDTISAKMDTTGHQNWALAT